MAATDLERERERAGSNNSRFMALPVPDAVILMEHPSPSCPPSSSRTLTPPNNLQFLLSLRRQPHLLLLSRNNDNHPFVSSKTSRRLLSACLPLIPAFLFFNPTLATDVHQIAVAADQIPVLAGKNDEPTSSDPFDPVSPLERKASARLSQRVSEAIRLLDNGREYQAKGDFPQALQCFSQVVRDYKDFAFSEYARVGRALALYELGDRDEAIVEMEDVSISLKGYPEVHAALAAALYVDKHAPLLAENQFTIATLLDPHYTDISYVRETKHWPPSLISSLQRFITFS